jgi:UDP-N-acetylmuramoyl-L-alanyl-D-glutamate--2,6-diaminopimelate ligase
MSEFEPVLLRDMLADLPGEVYVRGELEGVRASGVAADHRQVRAGMVFVALQGLSVDGHQFIPQAIQQGAVAVVGTQELVGLACPYARVRDGREALAALAAAFYHHPGHAMTVLGVTGTDGKTTTTNLIYSILKAAGKRAGIISTVNAVLGDEVIDTGFHVTTPDAPEVQHYLAHMRDAGLTHVVLESTSHGLAQQRVAGCEFDVAVVTNVTHEHLDFHKDYASYLQAKGRLFTMLTETPPKPQGNPRLGVLNRDDASYEYFSRVTTTRQVAYGIGGAADIRAVDVVYGVDATSFTVEGPGFRQEVESHLVGGYNVSNCLAAFAATVLGLQISPAAAAQGIAALEGIPGRMEAIRMGQDFQAIVDFAHTPNALRQALLAARKMTTGRVIAIFGSAGLRDREKRRLMAETSAGLADLTILTAEDPRTETLAGILAEMAAGATAQGGVVGKTVLLAPDRREALRIGVRLAAPGDLVMACGKGHEQSMCFGKVEYPWDDRTAMRAALAEHLGVPGPEMPFLPDTSPTDGTLAS